MSKKVKLSKTVMDIAPILGLFTVVLKDGANGREQLALRLMLDFLTDNGVENPVKILSTFGASAKAASGDGTCSNDDTEQSCDWKSVHNIHGKIDITKLNIPDDAKLLLAAVAQDGWLYELADLSSGTLEEFKKFYFDDSTTKHSEVAEWLWDHRTDAMINELHKYDARTKDDGDDVSTSTWEALHSTIELNDETLKGIILPDALRKLLLATQSFALYKRLVPFSSGTEDEYDEFMDVGDPTRYTELAKWLWEHRTPELIENINKL